MSLTTQSQETFTTRGTLTSGSPGNLGSVTGSFYKYPGGPRLSSDTSANSYGWSADLRLIDQSLEQVFHQMAVSSGAQTLGCFSTFHLIESLNLHSGASDFHCCGPNLFSYRVTAYTNHNFWMTLNGSGFDTTIAIPLAQWFELRTAWNHLSGSTFQFISQYRICGTSTWVTIYSTSTYTDGTSTVTHVIGGAHADNGAGSPTWRGRYAMPTVCTMGSFSDNTLGLPSLVDPRQTPYTWYIDPINGNDSTGDGTTLDSAYQTAANLSTLSANYGIFGGYNGVNWICKADSSTPNIALDATILGALIAKGQGLALNVFQTATLAAAGLSAAYAQGIIPNGDTVLIADNRGQEWRLDAAILLNTPGIYLATASGDPINCKTRISALKQINHASWSLTSGQTVVWQATAPYQFSCPLQNGRPMTAVSSVANCASTAGSFYADLASPTATIYVHPYGGLDPTQSASDGMMEVSWLYQPILQNCTGLIRGLEITGTVLYDGTSAVQGYPIQLQAASGINALLDCNAYRYDKHCFGYTANGSTNGRNIWINLNAAGGNPYVGFGGQTAFVDYYNNGSANQAYYDNCNITGGNKMLVGSTSYVNDSGQAAYICHGTTGTEMNKLTWVNCNFQSSAFLAPSIFQSVTPVNVPLTTGGAAPFIRPGEF